tara:strand:+ start:2724 stop:4199 length:1476 start_codon:yes stop_codon:yes gene_type:complete
MADESKGTNFYRIGQQMGPSKLDTSTGDILTNIGSQAAAMGKAIAEEKKAEEKKQKEIRNKAGDKISQAFVDMGPQLKQLGQESYTQAQNEVEELRYKMYEAIDAGDSKAQADLMIQLNEIKTRHAGDAEGLTALVETWEPDEDGNRAVSTDAMTGDDVKVMENFIANDSKRTIYEDGVMKYQWDVPKLDDNGQEILDEEGNPVMETKTYSLKDLQDKIILKDTVNGNKYLDLEQTMKETISNGGKPPTNAEMKRKVSEVIPRDDKKIRDWLHGNPAEQHDLNVNDYLIDLMNRDFGTFDKLGIDLTKPEYAYLDKDNPKDGVQADEVPQDFKDELIDNVMNVKDLEITHGILTDIYAARGLNNIMGVEYEEGDDIPGGFVGNKNYNTEDDNILGINIDQNEQDNKSKALRMEKLQGLSDPAVLMKYKGWTTEAIAKDIGVDPNQGIVNPESGEAETIATYIANATKKRAGGTAPAGLSAAEKLKWYKDNG